MFLSSHDCTQTVPRGGSVLDGLRLGKTTTINDESGAGLVIEWDETDETDDDDDFEVDWGDAVEVGEQDHGDDDGSSEEDAMGGVDGDVDNDDDDENTAADDDEGGDEDEEGVDMSDDENNEWGDDESESDIDDGAAINTAHPRESGLVLAADLVEPGDKFLAALGGEGGRGNTGGSPATRVTEKDDPRSDGHPGEERRYVTHCTHEWTPPPPHTHTTFSRTHSPAGHPPTHSHAPGNARALLSFSSRYISSFATTPQLRTRARTSRAITAATASSLPAIVTATTLTASDSAWS
jgi:hypothetical protein